MALTTAQIQQAYVTFFSRPADPVGLAYWQNYSGSVADLYATFAQQTEYSAAFSGLTSAQKVNVVYQNLFGRDAEATGLLYWAGQVEAGKITVANLALAVSAGSQGTDKVTVDSRVSAATSFTAALDTPAEILGYTGATANAAAKTWLAGVTTAANLATAVAAIDTAAAGVVAVGGAAGSTFTLTTGTDTFVGTANKDTFVADNTGTDTSSTSDSVDGGAGADTLVVYSDGAAGAMPNLTSVETITVYDQDDALDLTSNALDSATTVNLIRGDGLALTLGDKVNTVGLTDIAVPSTAGGNDIVVNFDAALTSATLNLSALTGTSGATDEDIEVNGAAIKTIGVNVSSASTADALDVDAATTININAAAALTLTGLATTGTATLNVSGAGAVTLGSLDADINTVTSTGSGALTAAIGAAVDTVLTGGSGNDVITASTADTIASSDTLSVDAGAGTADVLSIEETADVNTAADAARYKNFEVLRLKGGVTQVASLFTGLTGLEIISGATVTTGVNAATAANVKVRDGDLTTTTIALADSSGTSDVVNVTFGKGTTNVASHDSGVMTLTGFETVNLAANPGPTAAAGAARTTTIAGFNAINASAFNLTGSAFTITTLANDTGTRAKAFTLDGSALTGDGQSGTSNTGLTISGGAAYNGSTIIGSAVHDDFTVDAEGSTFRGGAGNDTMTTTVALLAADGATDLVLDGGTGTDTLTLSDTTGVTLTDTHFTNVTGFEKLTLTNTGAADTSITTGSAFNAAFANGVTITSGVIAATQDITIAAGLATVPVTVSIAATSQTGAATETNSITTGSGADSVTYTDTDWVGVAGANGTFTIDTRAGNDTIALTVGTLLAATGSQAITITGGAGTDTITKVGTNGAATLGAVKFVFAAGDSSTTAWDSITGVDKADGTAYSDILDFAGTGAVSAFSDTTDFGTIASHSITGGVASFDDIGTYTTALVINSSNLADVVGYLNANVASNGVVAFAYDTDNSGSADGLMVYHQGTTSTAADDLVLLTGLTTATLSADLTAHTDGILNIA